MTAKNDPRTANSSPNERLSFPRRRRIRSSLDFQRIYAKKIKAGNSILLLFASRNSLGTTRIGLSVSRRHGNSVVRHRLRRMLREAYRLEQHRLPEGLDLILIPGREAPQASMKEWRKAIVALVQRVVKLLEPTENPSPAAIPSPHEH